MKAPRLHELTARVVAWHNRHPLARRIDATQVHSVGEVRLPFVSAQAWGDAAPAAPEAPPAAPGPTLAEALAQRNARQVAAGTSSGIDGLEVQSMLPGTDAEADAALFDPAPARTAAAPEVDLALDAAPDAGPQAPVTEPDPHGDGDGADGEAALMIPLLDGEEAPAADQAAPADSAPDPAPPPAAAATAPDADGSATSAPAAATPDAPDAPDAAPSAPPATTRPSEPPPAPAYPPPHGVVPASSLARAVERRAAARGAAGHGDGGPADGPPAPPAGLWRRLLAVLRRAATGRQTGLPPLRAAFSQDFIWPLRPAQVARWAQRHGQPQPVAPADWPQRRIDADRARLARLRQKGLAHDLPLHVLTAAIGVGDRRIRVLVGADGSILGPRAYHPQRVGSACLVLAIGLVGLGWSLRPLHGLPGDADAAVLAALAASAAASAAPAASIPMAAASAPDSAASALALAQAASAADPAASQAQAGPAAAEPDQAAVAAAPAADAASQPQADIRPALSDEDRYAARVEAARLRGEPVPAPPATLLPGPVYAVVGPASRQRAAAAGSLARMKSAAGRLDGPVPEHGELVESQGQWRAAWWPFTSLVDAERARVLLAGQGIKAEVIEF